MTGFKINMSQGVKLYWNCLDIVREATQTRFGQVVRRHGGHAGPKMWRRNRVG